MSYEIGEKVEVHAFGHWYEGEVVKTCRKTIRVRYTTGTGTTRVKAAPLSGVRKLDPEDLEPVTLSSLPAPEVQEDHERACSFAGCGCPE